MRSYSFLRLVDYTMKRKELLLGALSSTPIPTLSVETGIIPHQFRRVLLANRLIGGTMISINSTLISAIRIVTFQWRFTQKKFPLIFKSASTILKFQKFTPLLLLPYHPTFLLLQLLLHKIEVHKIPNINVHSTFSSFILQNFSDATLIFIDGSKSPSGVSADFWIPPRHSLGSYPYLPSCLSLTPNKPLSSTRL